MSTYTVDRTDGLEEQGAYDIAHRTEERERCSQRRRPGLVIDVFVSLLAVLIGFAVFKTTGLYDGMDSAAGKIAAGSLISLFYAVVFRYACYSR